MTQLLFQHVGFHTESEVLFPVMLSDAFALSSRLISTLKNSHNFFTLAGHCIQMNYDILSTFANINKFLKIQGSLLQQAFSCTIILYAQLNAVMQQ